VHDVFSIGLSKSLYRERLASLSARALENRRGNRERGMPPALFLRNHRSRSVYSIFPPGFYNGELKEEMVELEV
jgi:hypothetical protein